MTFKQRALKGGLPSLIAPLVYLLLRLPGLLALPLFNDEAVYLWRAQRFPQLLVQTPYDSGTLPDGKLIQELLLAALARLPGDPLLPARLLSLACGLGTVLALALCGRRLGRPGAGLLAGLLYALAPLAQIHDRLAIPDSMLTLAGALLLAASIGYARGERSGRPAALGIGGLLAAAALVKLSGLLLAVIPLLAVLLLSAPGERWGRLAQLRLSLIVALAAPAALAPFHYGGAERQKIGGELSRLVLIGQNSALIGDWLLRYLPGPLLLLPLAALAWRKPDGEGPSLSAPLAGRRELTFLLAAGLALPAIFGLVGGSLASRYLLPAWPALLLAAALATQRLWQAPGLARGLVACCLAASLAWGGLFALRYSADPRGAPLAGFDRWQYTQSWTAGYGLMPLIAQLRGQAAAGPPLTLALHDQSRLAALAARVYLGDRPGITVVDLDLRDPGAPGRLRELAAAGPLYLLTDSQVVAAYRLRERFPGLEPLRQEQNPGGEIAFWLFAQRR